MRRKGIIEHINGNHRTGKWVLVKNDKNTESLTNKVSNPLL